MNRSKKISIGMGLTILIIIIALSSITYDQPNPINNKLLENTKEDSIISKEGIIVYRNDFEPFPYGLVEIISFNTETASVTYCLTGDVLNQSFVGKYVEIQAKKIENYDKLIRDSQLGMSLPVEVPCEDILLLVESILLQ